MTLFQVLVFGGYSAGGQMAQRYAILKTSTDDDDRLHFWIGNSSLLGGTTEGDKLIAYS